VLFRSATPVAAVMLLSPPPPPAGGSGLHITYSPGQVPELCRYMAAVLSVDVSFSASSTGIEHHPYLTSSTDITSSSVSGDVNISRYFVRQAGDRGLILYGGNNDPWLTSQIDQWLSFYRHTRVSNTYDSAPALVNAHLEMRTYICGHAFSIADIAVSALLKRCPSFNLSVSSTAEEFPHAVRWFNLVTPLIPFPKPLVSNSKSKKTRWEICRG